MKNVLKSILFVVILFVLLTGISYFLLPYDNVKKFGIIKVSSYEILSEELDTIDVLFLGDSLVYSSITPLEIWEKYGYTSYALGTPAQIIKDTYDLLKVSIESQHPKIVFLEANVLFRDPDNAPKYSRYNYTKRLNQVLPIINHHNNWKKVLFTFVDKLTNYSSLNDFKGFKYVTDIDAAKDRDYMKKRKVANKLPSNNLDYFKKIVKLCEENDIKLVLMSTPNHKSWDYSKYLGTKKLATEYNLEYIDLNAGNPLDIDWRTETKDRGSHVNYSGATKVTAYFAEYLHDLDMLTDHRNDEAYASWNSALERYNYTLECN